MFQQLSMNDNDNESEFLTFIVKLLFYTYICYMGVSDFRRKSNQDFTISVFIAYLVIHRNQLGFSWLYIWWLV